MNIIKQCFRKTNTESYFRIQTSPPNGKALSALALAALLFLPSQSVPNPSLWEMNYLPIPMTKVAHMYRGDMSEAIRDYYMSQMYGPTVFGINPENHAGTFIGYPVYANGHAEKNKSHDATPVDVRMVFSPVKPFLKQIDRRHKFGYSIGDHHMYRVGERKQVPWDLHTWVGQNVNANGKANNHNGANHVWISDKLVAYHTQHLSQFIIWDIEEEDVYDGPFQGELSHNSWGGKLYFSLDMNRSTFENPIGYGDQGVYVYDPASYTVSKVISKERIMKTINVWPNFEIDGSDVSEQWRTNTSINHVEPSPSGDAITLLYSHNKALNDTILGFEIDNADWQSYQTLVEIKEPGEGERDCWVTDDDNNRYNMKSTVHELGGCLAEIIPADDRPFHTLFFDENSYLAARPNVHRVGQKNGDWKEDLGSHAAHQGMSSDAEWYVSDVGKNGDYEDNPDSGYTEIYLSKRGQSSAVASLAKFDGNDFAWSSAAHANPAFSADGNRIYFLRGTDQNPEATLHYLDISAYRKTLHKYCAAGTPWNATGEERHIEAATLTQRVNRPDLQAMEDDGADDPIRSVDDLLEYFTATNNTYFEEENFLYGKPTSEHRSAGAVYDGEDYPPHGYDISPNYVWQNPMEVKPGRTYYLEILLDGRKDIGPEENITGKYAASAAVDWNQNGWFADEYIDEADEWVVDDVDFDTAIRARHYDPDRGVLRAKITVPQNAHAGETVMRVRLHDNEAFPQAPSDQRSSGFCNTNKGIATHTDYSNGTTMPTEDGSGIYKDTVTYDFPIRVMLRGNYSNACQGVGDVADTSADTGNSSVNTTWDGDNAPGAFQDDDTVWEVEGANEWIKKCYTSPKDWIGVELGFSNGTNPPYQWSDIGYKFDLEGLTSVYTGLPHLSGRWVKLIENGRSLGPNKDRRSGHSSYKRERFYFSNDIQDLPFVAVRFTGYGNSGDDESTGNMWNSMRYLKMIEIDSSKAQNFGLAAAASIKDAVDYVDRWGDTIYNRPNEEEGVYLEDTRRGTHYGGSFLEVSWTDNSETGQEIRSDAILKFSIEADDVGESSDQGYYSGSGNSVQVERATLRLTVNQAISGVTHRLLGYSTDWDASEVTWDNAPAYPAYPDSSNDPQMDNVFDLGLTSTGCPSSVSRAPLPVVRVDKKAESCAMINAFQVPGPGQHVDIDVTGKVNAQLKQGLDDIGFRIVQGQPVDPSIYTSDDPPIPEVSYFGRTTYIDRRNWPQLTYVIARNIASDQE